jgi:hypothetical protein
VFEERLRIQDWVVVGFAMVVPDLFLGIISVLQLAIKKSKKNATII